jgi:hypothetical protein
MRYVQLAGRLNRLEVQTQAAVEADLKAMTDAELAELIGPGALAWLATVPPEELWQVAHGGLDVAHRSVQGYRRWAKAQA